MKDYELLDAIGGIDAEFVEHAVRKEKTKRFSLWAVGPVAACLRALGVVVLAAVLLLAAQNVLGLDFLQPQKPILTFVVDSASTPDSETAAEINKYLRKSHAGYQVQFVSLPKEAYRQELYDYLERGEAADLIYTGLFGEPGLDYVLEGDRLLDLTDYLQTERGQVLYQSLPELCWKNVERGGAVYGVMPSFVTTQPLVYYVNRALMEKYGFSEEDFDTDLSGLEAILRKVKEGEGDDFIPMRLQSAQQLLVSDDYAIFQDLFAVDRATGVVCLSLEIPEIKENLDAAVRFRSEGLLSRMDITQMDDCLVYCAHDDGFPKEYSELCMADGTPAKFGEDVLRILPGAQKYYCDSKVVVATGVYADSTLQEEALDFLTKMMSEQRLADLMSYGVEGKDYELTEDGRVQPPQNGSLTTVDVSLQTFFGNRYLATPLWTEPADRTAAAEFAAQVEVSPFFEKDLHIDAIFPDEMDRLMAVIMALDAQIDQNTTMLFWDGPADPEALLREIDFEGMAKKVEERLAQTKTPAE